MKSANKGVESPSYDQDTSDFMGDIDFTSRSFIIQNLQLANEDVFSDPSLTIVSRDYISRSTCLQICFYLSLALKSFNRPPTILLFGAGHSGSLLIEYLIDCKLGHCLRIFARGDYATKHWNSRNVQSSSSLSDLLNGSKADIVVMCSGMSSFASICHTLIPFISRATFFISSCFGLSRKRIYNSLKTTNIFRTFQEPQIAGSKCNMVESLDNYISQTDIAGCSTARNTDHKNTEDCIPDKVRRDVCGLPQLTFEQRAADLIVKRCPKICNMIHLLENYYSLRGMTHAMARKQSIYNLLGRNTDEVVTQEMPMQGKNQYVKCRSSYSQSSPTSPSRLQMCVEEEHGEEEEKLAPVPSRRRRSIMSLSERQDSMSSTRSADTSRPASPRVPKTKDKDKDHSGLSAGLQQLQHRVVTHFQQLFSTRIRVTDIPPLSEVDRSDAMSLHADVRKRIQQQIELALKTDPDPGVGLLTPLLDPLDVSRGPSRSGDGGYIASPTGPGDADTLSLMASAAESLLREGDSSDEAAPVLVPAPVPAPTESQYDANKKDLELLREMTKAKILEELDDAPKMREPLGVAMHSDQMLLGMFREDSLFHENQNLFLQAGGGVEGDENEEGKGTSGRPQSRSAALIALLAEIDMEENRVPRH